MSLGQRIAKLRQERSLTLQEVADGAGLTPSFLSRLERDQVNISVANLRKLAHFFGVTMVYFFEGEDTGPTAELTRAVDRPGLHALDIDVSVSSLIPSDSDIDARLIMARAGTRQQGESERLVYMLRGHLRYQVGEELYVLEAGDTLFVRRDTPQRWECIGDEPAMFLVVRPTGRRE